MSDAPDKKGGRDKTHMFQSQTQTSTGEGGAGKMAQTSPSGLPVNYPANGKAFDELVAEDGSLRPQYAKLFNALEDFTTTDLQRRSDTCERLVNEQGIAYFMRPAIPEHLLPISLFLAAQDSAGASGRAAACAASHAAGDPTVTRPPGRPSRAGARAVTHPRGSARGAGRSRGP